MHSSACVRLCMMNSITAVCFRTTKRIISVDIYSCLNCIANASHVQYATHTILHTEHNWYCVRLCMQTLQDFHINNYVERVCVCAVRDDMNILSCCHRHQSRDHQILLFVFFSSSTAATTIDRISSPRRLHLHFHPFIRNEKRLQHIKLLVSKIRYAIFVLFHFISSLAALSSSLSFSL